jgi:hypothetical protein
MPSKSKGYARFSTEALKHKCDTHLRMAGTIGAELRRRGVGGTDEPTAEWVGVGGVDAEFVTWLKKNIRIRGGDSLG